MNIDERIRILEYENFILKCDANANYTNFTDVIEKRYNNKMEIRRLMKKKQRRDKLKRICLE